MERNLIASRLIKSGILPSNIYDPNKQEFYDNFVDEFTNELCNLSNNNENEDIMLIRKRIGILDKGIKQSYNKIGKTTGMSGNEISLKFEKIRKNIHKKISDYLLFCQVPLDLPASLIIDNEFKVMETLDITLKQVLQSSEENLNDICDILNADINDVIKKSHNLGYFFVFEMNLNSNPFIPIEYLNLDEKMIKNLKKYGFNTIYQIIVNNSKTFINLFNLTQNENKVFISKIHELGFKFLDENPNVYKRVTISNMGLSNNGYNCLYQNGFKTIDDIILKRKNDIKNIDGLTLKNYNEIIDKVHKFGYLFADETILSLEKKKLDNIKNDLIALNESLKSNLDREKKLKSS